MAFQLVDLENHQENVTCPHCQHAVLDWSQEQYLQPCEHSLFIAMDLGFEYISDEFEQTMQYTVDEIHANDENLNVFTEISKSTCVDFIVYRANLGVEGLYRYLGFVGKL